MNTPLRELHCGNCTHADELLTSATCAQCGSYSKWAPITGPAVMAATVAALLPVGEAAEMIPVGEALDLGADAIPAGDAFESIPTGEATELHLPAGIAAMIEQMTGASWEANGNPKDAVGSTKLPLNLVPDTLAIFAAMAFAEGAAKYGAYNWRASGVRTSIYIAALLRHLKKYWNGEWCDKVTKVPHLASVIACAAIILDANLVGKLIDDRPPAADMAGLIAECEEVVRHVAKLYADKTPHHWTINDKVPA